MLTIYSPKKNINESDIDTVAFVEVLPGSQWLSDFVSQRFHR